MKNLFYLLIALVLTTSNLSAATFNDVALKHNYPQKTNSNINSLNVSTLSANAFLQLEFVPHTNKFAGVYWLPDYLGDNASRVNDGGKEPVTCGSKGKVTCVAPFQGVGTPEVVDGNNCYDSCICKNVSNCTSAFNLSSPPANAIYSSCNEVNSGCVNSGNRYKIDSCKQGYELSGDSCAIRTCPSGFTAGLTQANCPNTTDAYDISGYSGTQVCGKCINTCSADYKYDSCPVGANCGEACGGKFKVERCQTAEGYELSGGVCVARNCPAGFTAGIDRCNNSTDIYSKDGKSGGKVCGRCVSGCNINDGWFTTIPSECSSNYDTDTQCEKQVYKCRPKSTVASITTCDELVAATQDSSYLEYKLLNNISCDNRSVTLPSSTKLFSEATEGRSILFTFNQGIKSNIALTMQNNSSLEKVNIKLQVDEDSGGKYFRGSDDTTAIYIEPNATVNINFSKIMLNSILKSIYEEVPFVSAVRLDSGAVLNIQKMAIKIFGKFEKSTAIYMESDSVINLNGVYSLLALSLNTDGSTSYGIDEGTINMTSSRLLISGNSIYGDRRAPSLSVDNINMNQSSEIGMVNNEYREQYTHVDIGKLVMKDNSRIYYNDLGSSFQALIMLVNNLDMSGNSKINIWADGTALSSGNNQEGSVVGGNAQINIKTKNHTDRSPLYSSTKFLFKDYARLIIDIINPTYNRYAYNGKVSFSGNAKVYSRDKLCENATTYVTAGVSLYTQNMILECKKANTSPINILQEGGGGYYIPKECPQTATFNFDSQITSDFPRMYGTGFNKITQDNAEIASDKFPFTDEWASFNWQKFGTK